MYLEGLREHVGHLVRGQLAARLRGEAVEEAHLRSEGAWQSWILDHGGPTRAAVHAASHACEHLSEQVVESGWLVGS